MLDDLFDYCFPILDKIGHKLDRDRGRHVRGRAPRRSSATSRTSSRRSSRYRKIIKPERSTLRLLERHIERFLPEELELYFDDIVDAAERIWDLLDNYKEVVEALEDTNESVISHRQNDVLRVLTLFSVMMLPLTLITGIFGMNVIFPGEGQPRRSGSSSARCVVTLVGMVGFFRWKRWAFEEETARGTRLRAVSLPGSYSAGSCDRRLPASCLLVPVVRSRTEDHPSTL